MNYQHFGPPSSLHIGPQKLPFVDRHNEISIFCTSVEPPYWTSEANFWDDGLNEISTFWTSVEPPYWTSEAYFSRRAQWNTNMLDLWRASILDLRSSLLSTGTTKYQHFVPPSRLHIGPQKITFVPGLNEISTFRTSVEPPYWTSEAYFSRRAQWNINILDLRRGSILDLRS